MPIVDIKGVGEVEFPDEMSQEEIVRAIERDVIPQYKKHLGKTGGVKAAEAGLRGAVGAGAEYIGGAMGVPAIAKFGAEQKAKAAEAYEPTTESDIAAAQGILPTAGAWVGKHVTEPVGGIIGRYAIPTAAGAVASALAPEAAVATTALRALPWAARALGFTAAEQPISAGENIERQREVSPEAEPEYGKAGGYALVQALIAGGLSPLGGPASKAVGRIFGKEITAEAAALAPKVLAGEITEAAAIKSLQGRAMQYGRAVVQNAVGGAGMVAETEALRRAQAGQEVTGPEATEAYLEHAKGALELAPLFGAYHVMGQRGTAEGMIKGAESERVGKERARLAEEEARIAEEARAGELPPFTRLDDLAAFGAEMGIGNTAKILKETSPLLNRDISNLDDAIIVRNELERFVKKTTNKDTIGKISEYLKRPEFEQIDRIREIAPISMPNLVEMAKSRPEIFKTIQSNLEQTGIEKMHEAAQKRAEQQRVEAEKLAETQKREAFQEIAPTKLPNLVELAKTQPEIFRTIQQNVEQSGLGKMEDIVRKQQEKQQAEAQKEAASQEKQSLAQQKESIASLEPTLPKSFAAQVFENLTPFEQNQKIADLELQRARLAQTGRTGDVGPRPIVGANEPGVPGALTRPQGELGGGAGGAGEPLVGGLATGREGAGEPVVGKEVQPSTLGEKIVPKTPEAVETETQRSEQKPLEIARGPVLSDEGRAFVDQGDLQGLLSHLASTHENPDISRILGKIQSLGLKTKLETGETGKAGVYDPTTDTITMSPTLGMNRHTAIHEPTHAALSHVLDNKSHPLTKKFEKFFSEVKDKLGDEYGGKNLQEFAAELTGNGEFQTKLKGIKAPEGNLFRRIVSAIAEFFGFKKGTNAYDRGIKLIEEALDVSHEVERRPGEKLFLERPDGTPVKFKQKDDETIVEKVKDAFSNDSSMWRKVMDTLGNKIVGGRYTLERKALDKNLSAADAQREGRIRGDLINLQATNAAALANAGLYSGKLSIRKSGLVRAEKGEYGMLDVAKEWHDMLEKMEKQLGSKELAYDMASAGWYGPRYKSLGEHNKKAEPKDFVDISDWTDSDKKTADEAWNLFNTEQQKLKDMRNSQRADLLKLMVDSGLYSKEVAEEYLDRMEYVPMYRIQEESLFDKNGQPITNRSGLLGVGKEFKIKGSDKTVDDPIRNYTANMMWMMQRAIKNNAARASADLLEGIGEGYYPKDSKGGLRNLTDGEKKVLNYITIYKDGKPRDFVVNDPNDLAAFAGSPVISGLAWDMMKYPTSALRHTVTMMPQFMWNQAWMDPVRATFVAGNKAGFAKNLKDTWTSVLKNQFSSEHSPDADLLHRYGIIGQKDILDAKDIENMYQGKDKAGWRKYMFFLERLAQGSDLGARESIFKNAVKELQSQGYDLETAQDLAAVRAHQYMPYQQVGTSRSLAYLRRMIPFVNPVFQGLARDVAAARGRLTGVTPEQGKKMLMMTLAKYAIFTGAYSAFRSGDDDYENQSDEQRDNNFFVSGMRIGVPQELRPLKALIERGTRSWVMNAPRADIDNPEIAAAVIRRAWETVAGIVPIPTMVRAPLENIVNYDFFTGRPVVGRGIEHLAPAQQVTANTSELAKSVGQSLDVSPVKVDHLLRGYFGYVADTVNKLTNAMSGDRRAANQWEQMLWGTAFENPYGSGPKTDFYDLLNKTTEARDTMNNLAKSGEREKLQKWVEENKGYLGAFTEVNRIHNELTKMRQYKQQIDVSDRSPEEKRDMYNQINQMENQLLSNIRPMIRMVREVNESK